MSQKKHTDDDVIIEAEIIDEKPRASQTSTGATTQASVKTSDIPPAKNTAARIGWGIALLLVAFVGGIFMEPLAEQGLKRLGLMKETVSEPLEAQLQNDVTPLKATQTEQNERLKLLESTFQAQSEKIQTLENENTELKRDITTLSSELPTVGAATISIEQLTDVTNRLVQAEALLVDLQSTNIESQTEGSAVTRLEGELKLARAESAQVLERLLSFEKSFQISQSTKLSDSPEGRAAVTLHRLYLNATAGADYASDIAALKPDLTNLPLLDIQPVSKAMAVLQANQAGIATHSEIVRDFNALIPSLLKENVKEETTGWLASFFTVRRTDARAEGVEAVIHTIETHLINRDLSAANDAVNTLPEPLKALTKEWQNKTLAREATLSALTDLLNTLAGSAS